MNNISQKQNTIENLDKLAAQRQLYSDAKQIQIISFIVCIPLPIIFSILIAIFPAATPYTALLGILITFLEIFVFSQLQKKYQEKAAKIQQLFDCEVLQFSKNRLNCDIHIEPEAIINASNKYKNKDPNYLTIKNWYPTVIDQLPIYQARIVCQRSNIRWDSKLRLRYSNLIIIILLCLTIIIVLIGLIRGLTIEKFILAILVQLMPMLVLGLRQYTENRKTASRLDSLKHKAENLLEESVSQRFSPQDLENESYILQNEIYDNRRYSPLIFEWFYYRLRTKDEEQMNKGAEALTKQLLQNP